MPLPGELIQVAGVRDARELDLLCELGVPLAGFPLDPDVHAPDVGEREAARLISRLPQTTRAVLITYLSRADAIAALADGLGVDIVQLHGDVTRGELEALRARRPGLSLVRSLVVRAGNEQELAARLRDQEPFVDAWISDTFDPSTGASGATGRIHDWGVSRRLARRARRPLILAGGLTPDNVERAIRAVRPAGVDAHTGLEDEAGRKDRDKVRRFLERARRALDG